MKIQIKVVYYYKYDSDVRFLTDSAKMFRLLLGRFVAISTQNTARFKNTKN
jgi:hypothetical protein